MIKDQLDQKIMDGTVSEITARHKRCEVINEVNWSLKSLGEFNLVTAAGDDNLYTFRITIRKVPEDNRRKVVDILRKSLLEFAAKN